MPLTEEVRSRKREAHARWKKDNPERYKEVSAETNRRLRFRRYGMTEESFDSMLASQGGVCAVCAQKHERWCIDHDHSCCPVPRKKTMYSCGKCVRGILCSECNLGLSKFKDDPNVMMAAAAYLQRRKNHGN